MDAVDTTEKRRVIRTASLKRKSKVVDVSQRVSLEKVLGLTVSSNAGLSVDPSTGVLAYPAGCVVVLFNPRKHKQSHIFNTSKKTITCLAFAGDGKHLVTGESGHQPHVRLWDIDECVQLSEFLGHKFGVSCVAFSPNLKYIVSVGTQHDQSVNVWNWRTNTKVASNKISSKVSEVAFSQDGSFFVTVGNRHVKFWYLDASKSRIKTQTVPLQGRSAIIGEQKNNFFCGVATGRGNQAGTVYAITQSGLLCEFNAKRLLDKWVELRTSKAYCISAGSNYIFVGCSDGVVRVFSAQSLHFITTMPKPHYLGVDVAAGMDPSHMIPQQGTSVKYPDCIALDFDVQNNKVICIYNDRSLYMWDVKDVRKIGKSWSFLFHSSCIWGLEVYPMLGENHPAALPPGSFITCSSDDTIRIWNLDPHMSNETNYKRNIYSHELLKILYLDKNLAFLCDKEFNPSGSADKTDTTYDGKNGVRTVRVCPDGQHLASGDRTGNIRVHNIHNMDELCIVEAHDAEVLCLEYTSSATGPRLLSSASRDRLIHVFDAEQDYTLIQTLDDHSSSITAVNFTENDGQLKMLSCGADKSVLFRTAQQGPDGEFQFVLDHHLVGKVTLYDMDIDPTNKFAATACQDRNVRIYNVRTGKQKKCYKGSLGDDGTLIKVQLDPSGSFVATSSSDKSLALFDFYTGECVGTMFGHSEIATGVKFANDLKHLITVSGDGCIFVWKLRPELTEQMYQRMFDLGQIPNSMLGTKDARRGTFVKVPKLLSNAESNKPKDDTDFGPPPAELFDPSTANTNAHNADYRFSVGHLPAWAKKQIAPDPAGSENTLNNLAQPKGRWAQRVGNQSIAVKSVLDDSKAIELNFNSLDRRRFTAEPDALSDLGNLRRETMVLDKSTRPSNITIVEDDENNQDDDDDDEFFPLSSREQIEQKLNQDGMDLVQGGSIGVIRGSDPQGRPSIQVPSTPSEEEDEDGQGEVIYYPPNENGAMSPDAESNSFQVFAITKEELKEKRRQMKLKKQMLEAAASDSLSDGQSHRGDPNSEDEMGDDEMEVMSPTSNPTTPLPPGMAAQAMNDQFENNYSDLQQPMNGQLMHSRLSISAKFLSRAQQAQLGKNSGLNSGGVERPTSLEVDKKKEAMNKQVNDTRKRLNQLGWPGGKGGGKDEVPVRDTNHRGKTTNTQDCPPTRLANKENIESGKLRDAQQAETNRQRRSKRTSLHATRSNPPGGTPNDAGTPDSAGSTPIPPPRSAMRRAWSSVDVSRQPLTEAPSADRTRQRNLPQTPDSQTSQTAQTLRNYVAKLESQLGNLASPTSPTRGSSGFSARSRSEANLIARVGEQDRDTPTGVTTSKASYRRQHSYMDQTQSSVAKTQKISKAASTTGLNIQKQLDSEDPNNLTKATSVQGLAQQFEDDKTEPSSSSLAAARAQRRKNRIAKAKSMDFSSSPGLIAGETSESDTNTTKNLSTLKSESGQRLPNSSGLTRDTHKGSQDSLSSISDLPYDNEPVSSTKQNRKSPSRQEDADRLAMPPPATLGVKGRSNHDTFLKRASQSKRRSNADISLSQAKDILLGRSGILSKATSMDSGLNLAGKSFAEKPGVIDIDSKSDMENSKKDMKGNINVSSPDNSKSESSSSKGLKVSDSSDIVAPKRRSRTPRRKRPKSEVFLRSNFAAALADPDQNKAKDAESIDISKTASPEKHRQDEVPVESKLKKDSGLQSLMKKFSKSREGLDKIQFDSPTQTRSRRNSIGRSREDLSTLSLSSNKFSFSSPSLNTGKLSVRSDDQPGTSDTDSSMKDVTIRSGSNVSSPRLQVQRDSSSPANRSNKQYSPASTPTRDTLNRKDSNKSNFDPDSSSDSLPSYGGRRRAPSSFSPAGSSSPRTDLYNARSPLGRGSSPMLENEKDPVSACSEVISDWKKATSRVTDLFAKVSRSSQSDEQSRHAQKMLEKAFQDIYSSLAGLVPPSTDLQDSDARNSPRNMRTRTRTTPNLKNNPSPINATIKDSGLDEKMAKTLLEPLFQQYKAELEEKMLDMMKKGSASGGSDSGH